MKNPYEKEYCDVKFFLSYPTSGEWCLNQPKEPLTQCFPGYVIRGLFDCAHMDGPCIEKVEL